MERRDGGEDGGKLGEMLVGLWTHLWKLVYNLGVLPGLRLCQDLGKALRRLKHG